MPSLLTHYYFAKECIEQLEDKYKETFNYSDKRLFLYSNIFNLPKYYKLDKLFAKENDEYKIYTRLDTKNKINFINETIMHLKRNNFDRDNVLFLYGVVCQYVLDLFLTPYVTTLVENQNNIDEISAKKAIDNILFKQHENKSLYDINLYKKFKGAYIFTFANLEVINIALKQHIRFSKPEEFFKISLNNLKKFSSYMKNSIFIYNIVDKFKKKDHSQKRSRYLYTKKDYVKFDYLNKELEHGELSFDDMYLQAMTSCQVHLEAINKFLFYNNDKDFKKIFNI